MVGDGRSDRRISPQVVIGGVIILYGLLRTADNLGWIEAGRLFSFWPLALLAIGLTMVARATDWSSRMIALFVAGAGGFLSVVRLLGWPVNLSVLWPLLLVGIGVSLVIRASGRGPDGSSASDRQTSAFAIWSGNKRRVTSQAFRGADFSAVMGGIEVDFRGAAIGDAEAVVDVFVVMGGIEITVPPDWTVSNQVVAVMAGVDDRSTGGTTGRQRLLLRGFVMMGSVEVKT
jgi:predicted membrane protein